MLCSKNNFLLNSLITSAITTASAFSIRAKHLNMPITSGNQGNFLGVGYLYFKRCLHFEVVFVFSRAYQAFMGTHLLKLTLNEL